ncbi:MAG TPA: pyruvate:ferredoxin (flavodoxin) oxidoreductase [Bacilli bacterium]|nr:pyruvate:ferredoxin (flavodoxin) oxidoreductase [Bacilli bacterium]
MVNMKIVDGNKACADTAYLLSEVCPIYPITPASPMSSEIDKLIAKGELNLFHKKVKLVEMQSEAGAVATMHGALLSGSLATTFTASQGLLLMLPNMYKIAGEMLPGVIHVASRTVATHALSIFGDHSDIYAARNTGFCMISSASVEDAQNLALVSHLAAIKGSLPFLHFFDGFRTSHELNSIKKLNLNTIENMIPEEELNNFRERMLFGPKKIQKGMAQNEDVFFQMSEARNNSYMAIPDIVNDYMQKVNQMMGTSYKPFTYYGDPYATRLIIAMGSVTDTIKLTVNKLNEKGAKVGVVTVHLYRPFSSKYLKAVIPSSVKSIAVLDRAKDATLGGEPLYLDVLNALNNKHYDIVGGRYGLASKNTTPQMIKSVYDMLDTELKNNFTIGIEDDVTHLSLPIDNTFNIDLALEELNIYGFGSDGMVSASKDILKVLGEEQGYFVQGYFKYDSKKSNGITISNLRYGKRQIKAPFYNNNPKLVVITKDEYLRKLDMFKGIKEYGTVILNTPLNETEIFNKMKSKDLLLLQKNNIKFYYINASKLALEAGIKGKINKIMETIILKYLNIPDYEEVVIEGIKKVFKTKGEDVINTNIKAIQSINDNLKILDLTKASSKKEEEEPKDIVSIINDMKGDELKVSEVYQLRDGSFPCATSKYEKRNTALEVPKWNKENCIQCGLCSLVCPHAVIRPFIVGKEDKYAKEGIKVLGNLNDKFIIAVSEKDCTGCGLCINVCPGKGGNKALSFGHKDEEKQKIADDLFNNYENKNIDNKFTIKGSQLAKPLFEFSGACAGCGETPYIKLLTQLFGKKLVIANATGCSSIYGGSVPSTPYLIPWANSLFEDNAEFGLGILLGYEAQRDKAKELIKETMDSFDLSTKKLLEEWLENPDDYTKTKLVKEELRKQNLPKELSEVLEYISAKSIWAIGGDGWAYDIGYGGIDHVLASNADINILVLDTEVYSNTGGQASKSSHLGQVCEFADLGKTTAKKDLFRKAITYPNVYAATVSLGANPMQTIKAFKEAEEHKGPSIIIAYAPCIEHGIKCGLTCGNDEQKKLVNCGYLNLMRYNNGILTLDSKEPDFTKYAECLNNEVRYSSLKIKNPSLYEELTKEQIEEAKKRYNYYLELSKKE